MRVAVRIDPTRCRGHAICALFFEGVEFDRWGHGRVVNEGDGSTRTLRRLRRAAAACPNGAFVLAAVDPPVATTDAVDA
jgi:ferredoxin